MGIPVLMWRHTDWIIDSAAKKGKKKIAWQDLDLNSHNKITLKEYRWRVA